jgi:hypothetical protein
MTPSRITFRLTAITLAVLALTFALIANGAPTPANGEFGVHDPLLGYVDAVAVDVDTTGNTPTSVQSVETCRADILFDGDPAAPNPTLFVDIVLDEIHPGDTLGGIATDVVYNNAVLSVVTRGGAESVLQGGAQNATYFDAFSDALPDIDGDYRHEAASLGGGPFPSGEGVAVRMELEVIGAGVSPLDLVDRIQGGLTPVVLRAGGAPLAVNIVLDGEIRTNGSPCTNECEAELVGAQGSDANGIGDPCETDVDADGVDDAADNCPRTANPGQEDWNADGAGDACQDYDDDGDLDAVDNCFTIPNADQRDRNFDGEGDACDDTDGDGILDLVDNCWQAPNAGQDNWNNDGNGDACQDFDGDGLLDDSDNCDWAWNPDQADEDADGSGDACREGPLPECPVEPEFAFSHEDPMDDRTRPWEQENTRDILSVAVEGDPETVCITVSFATPIHPSMAAFEVRIGFDIDEDAGTGIPFGKYYFDPPYSPVIWCGTPAAIGADRVFSLPGRVYETRRGPWAGYTLLDTAEPVPIAYSKNSFTTAIPISLIGGDTAFNFEVVSADGPLWGMSYAQDCAPDGMSLRSPDGALVPPQDLDGDGFLDWVDNCPGIPNDGSDGDADWVGDACDPTPTHDLQFASLGARVKAIHLQRSKGGVLQVDARIENLSPWPEQVRVGRQWSYEELGLGLEGLPSGCSWELQRGGEPTEIAGKRSAKVRADIQITCDANTLPGTYQVTVDANLGYTCPGPYCRLPLDSADTEFTFRIK